MVGQDILESDDACHKGNASQCAASWLQRRARRVQESPPADAHKLAEGKLLATASAVHASQRGSAESISATNSSATFCDTHTGGTCKYFSCKSSRGQTQCVNGQCRCQPGHCAVGGSCVPNDHSHNFLQCPQRTGGSCSWFGYCWQYRGPTRCVNGECMCQPGGYAAFANVRGSCFRTYTELHSVAAAKACWRTHWCCLQHAGIRLCARARACCGVLCCGVLWCGVVWCGVVWCGVVCCVVLCCVVLCCVCCVVLCCVLLCCVVLCCVVLCWGRSIWNRRRGYCSDDDGKCHKKMPDVYADVVPVNDEQKQFPPRQAGWKNS